MFCRNFQELVKKKVIKIINVFVGGRFRNQQFNFAGNIVSINNAKHKASLGYVQYHPNPIFLDRSIVVYSLNENLLVTEYLFLIFKIQQDKIYEIMSCIKVPLRKFNVLEIPFLSITEQKKVVTEYKTIVKSIKKYTDDIKKIEEEFRNNIKEFEKCVNY